MKPIEVNAHLNSMDGKTGGAILLGPNYLFARPITNSYVFKVGGQLCTPDTVRMLMVVLIPVFTSVTVIVTYGSLPST